MHSLCTSIRCLTTPSARKPRACAPLSAHSESTAHCAGFITSANRRETLSGSTSTNSFGDSSRQSFSHDLKARHSSSRISAAGTRPCALVTSCVLPTGMRKLRAASQNTQRPSRRRSSTATTRRSGKNCLKPSRLIEHFSLSSRLVRGQAALTSRAGRASRSLRLAPLPALPLGIGLHEREGAS